MEDVVDGQKMEGKCAGGGETLGISGGVLVGFLVRGAFAGQNSDDPEEHG